MKPHPIRTLRVLYSLRLLRFSLDQDTVRSLHWRGSQHVGRRCEREKLSLRNFAVSRFLLTRVGADSNPPTAPRRQRTTGWYVSRHVEPDGRASGKA